MSERMKMDFKNRRGERLDAAFHEGSMAGVLVVLGHGVTGNKDRPLLVALANGLAELGWPCLRISFSGNGKSGGRFEEATVTKESEDLLDLLDQLPDGVRVAYCGHSMGGAVGVKTAAVDRRIEVVVNLAGMIRTREFCEREFGDVTPGGGMMWGEEGCPLSQAYVDDMAKIDDLLPTVPELKRPFLMIHGTADDVVFPKDSRDAWEVAAEPKRLVEIPGAGHSFEGHHRQVIDEVEAWLRLYLV